MVTVTESKDTNNGVYTMGVVVWVLYGMLACGIGSAATLVVLWLLRGYQLPVGY